jgi:hypothetical protein
MRSKDMFVMCTVLFLLLLVSCDVPGIGSPDPKATSTPRPTSMPMPTYTPKPTATPRPTPTPTITPVAAQLESIRLSAMISPQANAERWSPDRFVIEIEVQNLEPEQQVVDVTARCSEDFRFIPLDREPNQEVLNSGHGIVQKELTLAPLVGDRPSYKKVYFGFTQAENVTAGTHSFVIQVDLPAEDPIRVSVVFEVLGGYIIGTPTPKAGG